MARGLCFPATVPCTFWAVSVFQLPPPSALPSQYRADFGCDLFPPPVFVLPQSCTFCAGLEVGLCLPLAPFPCRKEAAGQEAASRAQRLDARVSWTSMHFGAWQLRDFCEACSLQPRLAHASADQLTAHFWGLPAQPVSTTPAFPPGHVQHFLDQQVQPQHAPAAPNVPQSLPQHLRPSGSQQTKWHDMLKIRADGMPQLQPFFLAVNSLTNNPIPFETK